MGKQQIGVIGLAVMGKNLALNIESKGYSVAVYNRSPEKTEILQTEARGKNIHATFSIEELVNALERPRKILIMAKAGQATDQIIEQLIPYLKQGDLLIDGGNTYFRDTIRRSQALAEQDIYFIGTGISGGEEGALTGPAIMPGGDRQAYELVRPILEAIAAKVDGLPCCTYIGPNGAGHYVKMVHNGIEYGDMQLIAESYSILKHILDLDASALHAVFSRWNEGELNSYLIEITADIFQQIDQTSGKPLVDMILDQAEQKGTGKWTSQEALDLGVPLPIITESVFARFLSAQKEERVNASKLLHGPEHPPFAGDKDQFIESVRQALYFSKLCSYAQGFAQMKAASAEYNWGLNYSNIATIFRGGCIIRAQFLEQIIAAFERDPDLPNLLLDPYFRSIADKYQGALREVVCTAVTYGLPIPGFSSALAYYDSYRSERLPANLIQAQRDYFGAHTYRRIDREGIFHTQWL